MRGHVAGRWKQFVVAGVMAALVAGMGSTLPTAHAAGIVKADDDKWISIGMGIRSSFNAQQNGAPNGISYSNDFMINNARIYLNGQVHKYLKFEFNTECFSCSTNGGAGPFASGPGVNQIFQNFGGNSAIGLLDAIAKFEFNEKVNIWAGRMLLPSERGELNGPFFMAVFDGFRTPLFPADFSANFNGPSSAGGGAGVYGRDNGVTFWGKIHPFGTHLLYVATVSQGLRNGPDTSNTMMYTGRLQWNLLNDEPSPGYYTAGTYYGTAGDILAIAGNLQHQGNGAGNLATGNVSDFTGVSVDLLFEKVLPNDMGVFTLNSQFKRFFANYGVGAFGPSLASPLGASCFCVFNGHSAEVLALYLIPNEIGIGRFQPYFRFVTIDPRYSSLRQEFEGGTNYVIAGHNARISAYARYGDLDTKGALAGTQTFGPFDSGNKVVSFHVAVQVQY